MASGEMSSDEFLAFNQVWIEQAGRHLVEGGIIGTFIDWRGYPAVHAAATAVGLLSLNLVVWSKTNAGMGSLIEAPMSCCRSSRRARRHTSTMSSLAVTAAGARTFGPIREPRRSAPMPSKAFACTRL